MGVARFSPGRLTLAAFIAACLIGGSNAVAVRYSNAELAPFWGATIRFLGATLILGVWVVALRMRFPQGRALVGAIVYGVLNFGLSYALVYFGLVDAPAGPAQTVLAIVPLLTLVLAVVHGIERFSWRGLVGSLVAAGGIAVVFGDQLGAAVPLISLVALLAAAVCIAEVGVAVKWFPYVQPAMLNAVGMAIGTAILFALALVFREPLVMPVRPETWVVLVYLAIGSVVLFMLVLYVLNRWTASASSYAFLILPLVTIVLAAVLRAEPIRAGFLVGGVLVLVGVYIGALARPAAGKVRSETDETAPLPAG